MKELWHGTTNGYDHHKCRCDDCSRARAIYDTKRYHEGDNLRVTAKRLREQEKLLRGEYWHGTYNGYVNRKCRCNNCKLAKKDHAAKYYLANSDKIKARVQNFNLQNPDKKREYRDTHQDITQIFMSKWRGLNQDKSSGYRANRRALKLNQLDENVSRNIVFDRDKGVCYLCGTRVDPINWHLDHKVPLSRGGRHSYANTGVTHPRCNLSKGAKLNKI